MPELSFPFQGGLNLVSGPLNLPPGNLIGCRNYEIALSGGYRRIGGYVAHVGDIYIQDENGENITDELGNPVSIIDPNLPIAGSGPIRGVWIFNGTAYAFRDNEGGTAGVMHKATGAGWTTVSLGRSIPFTSGGTYEITEGDAIVGETSAATATVTRVIKTSGDWTTGDAAGRLIFATQTGTFGAETIKVGANLNVASIAADSTAITLPPAGQYEFVNHNFYGASDRFRMYGVNGVGTGFEFDGTVFAPIVTTMPEDKPSHLIVFRDHLFFSFPGGSVQHSGIGEPQLWAPIFGAAELGAGQEVIGFSVEVSASMFAFCRNKTKVLYGTSVDDWDWQDFSTDTGAIAGTIQSAGKTIYLDDRGLTSLSAAREFGNFTTGILSQAIAPLIQTLKDLGATASCVSKSKGQYRIFFGRRGLYLTFVGSKLAGIMEVEFPHEVRCAVSGESANGNEVIFFGDEAGNVYQMDIGTSFDGEPILGLLRFPFYSYKSPLRNKRFRRALFEAQAEGEVMISVIPEFDYGGEDSGSETVVGMMGSQGWWDLSNWDSFNWSVPYSLRDPVDIDGQGANMGLLVSCESAVLPSHTLFGVTVVFDYRGSLR